MNEEKFFNGTYDAFWANQTKKYGNSLYEQYLAGLIAQSSPKRVFEVGIGTGWPIGRTLKDKGIEIDGCDLSEASVAAARKELENYEGIWVGNVLSYTSDIPYDVVYCVRTSWCIPDFYETLEKMMSMVKAGGCLVFDVMDGLHPYCLSTRFRMIKESYYKFLGIKRDEIYGHHFINIYKMKAFLKSHGFSCQCWTERTITGNVNRHKKPKVIFYAQRSAG